MCSSDRDEPADDLAKSIPAEIAKKLAAQAAQIASLLAAQNEASVEKRYSVCNAIPVDESTLKSCLKSCSPAAYEVLVAAASAIEKSTLSEPLGSGPDGTPAVSDAYAAI